MTWDDSNLYVAVENASVAEGALIYLDVNQGAAPAGGSTVGQVYDNQAVGTLPFAADFVAFAKDTYRDYRTADGAGGWSAPQTDPGPSICVGAGTREIVIPWSFVGGRPASFSFLMYLTSNQGFVYGELPTENPDGAIGTNSVFTKYYRVNDAGTPNAPFAVTN